MGSVTFVPGPTLVVLWIVGTAGLAFALAAWLLPAPRDLSVTDPVFTAWLRVTAALFALMQLVAVALLL